MKTFRQILESRHMTHVYHISPKEGLHALKPKSGNKYNDEQGIYVAPSFVDAAKWFTSYVAWKKDDMHYKTAYVYKIEIPEEILQRSWSESFWEKEYFIVKSDIPRLKIVSVKKYTYEELNGIEKRYDKKRRELKDMDPLRVARSVENKNLAAKMYVEIREKLVKLAFKGIKIEDKELNTLMHELVKMFKDFGKNLNPDAVPYLFRSTDHVLTSEENTRLKEIASRADEIIESEVFRKEETLT